MLRAAPFALLLAAGCSGHNAAESNREAPAGPSAAPVKPIAPPAARPVTIDEETGLLDFHLAWPAEVTAIPELAAKIRTAAAVHKAELLKSAAKDKAYRDKEHFPFNAYEFGQDLEIEGNTPRLLSLTDNWYEFTGGAHPNHGTRALLWNRRAAHQIAIADLFEGGAAALDALFRSPYCAALDKARAEKRGPEEAAAVVGPDDPFNQCPKFAELALIPGGAAGRPMTKVTIHADPYVAGAYAEGDYDIELPVTAAMLAALKPEYRPDFAVR